MQSPTSSRTRKNRLVIPKCTQTFCKQFVKRIVSQTMKMRSASIKTIKQNMKNEKLTNEIKQKMQSLLKNVESITTKQVKQGAVEGCLSSFCNPGCKGTMFEDGTKLPMSVIQKIKDQPNSSQIIQALTKIRKDLFKGKKTVLNNDFYEGLKNMEELRRQGAISGCSIYAL